MPRRMLIPRPEPWEDFAAGWRFVFAVDEALEDDEDLEVVFLVVERAAPDAPDERVLVLVFRAGEEVPRDAMVHSVNQSGRAPQ